jgi:uncharacterized protein (DUF1778 family)
MGTNSNFALRLPASLKAAIEELAKKDGTTINQFIVSAAAEKMSALNTAEFFARRGAKANLQAFDRIMNRKSGQPPDPGDEMP